MSDDDQTRPDTLAAILDETRRARSAAENTADAVQALNAELRDLRATVSDHGQQLAAIRLGRTVLPLVALASSLVSVVVCIVLLLVVLRMAGAG